MIALSVHCHPQHLGELNQFAKYTNYELGVRIPFLVHLPGQTTAIRTDALAEACDIFPTTVAAAGLPAPPLCAVGSQEMYCVEGVSLLPLWQNPKRPWKRAAFSQFPRPNRGFPEPESGLPPFCEGCGEEAVMGYSVRVDEWRYTEWVAFQPQTATPNWDSKYGRELYDHTLHRVPQPPFNEENINLVENEAYGELVANLSALLRAGWRKSLPTL
eukprot:SAG31_NODE_3902_length_3768_cov_5.032979_3_plen_215_part_00